MPRVSKFVLDKNIKDELANDFYHLLHSFSSKDELSTFVEELLTNEEKTMLFKRLALYKMIETGHDNSTIIESLSISMETVRVHKMRYSSLNPLFKDVIKKILTLKNSEKMLKQAGKAVLSTFSIADLMKKKIGLER